MSTVPSRSAVALVRACHPEPTAAVTVIAATLAASTGGPALRVAAAFAAGQLTTGWTNDWLDRDRDVRSARRDKPLVQGTLAPATLARAAGLAAASCVPLSLRLGPGAGAAHLAAVGSALAYNAGLKRGPLSFLPYAVSFGLLPSVVTLASPVRAAAPAWATTAGALLGVGAHLTNALPDLEDDLASGVRGLPHRLGRSVSSRVGCGLLLLATGVLARGPGRPGRAGTGAVLLAAGLTGAGLASSRRPGSRAPFQAALAVALVDVALLVARGARLTPG